MIRAMDDALACQNSKSKVDASNITICTETRKKFVRAWLREFSSCPCSTAMPGSAWILLSKICNPFFNPLSY